MKKQLFISLAFTLSLTACTPGPITLGGSTPNIPINGAAQATHYHVNTKPTATVPAGLKGSDLITAKITSVYSQNPFLKNERIAVETKRGVVKLSGQVSSNEVKQYAIKIARNTKGVLAIDAKNLIIR